MPRVSSSACDSSAAAWLVRCAVDASSAASWASAWSLGSLAVLLQPPRGNEQAVALLAEQQQLLVQPAQLRSPRIQCRPVRRQVMLRAESTLGLDALRVLLGRDAEGSHLPAGLGLRPIAFRRSLVDADPGPAQLLPARQSVGPVLQTSDPVGGGLLRSCGARHIFLRCQQLLVNLGQPPNPLRFPGRAADVLLRLLSLAHRRTEAPRTVSPDGRRSLGVRHTITEDEKAVAVKQPNCLPHRATTHLKCPRDFALEDSGTWLDVSS